MQQTLQNYRAQATGVPSIPSPTGDESVSGLRSIPTPDSIGMLTAEDRARAVSPVRETTIKRGETLSKIARDNDLTVGDLLDANPQITDPNRIREGQRINVPSVDRGEGDGSAPPSQEAAAPSQDISITKEAEIAQENLRKKAEIARKIGVPVLNLAVPGAGTLFGQGLKYLNESTQKLVDSYQSASMTERKEMEEAFPNLIAHGKAMGINTYYGIDKYNSWADERGLRAPQSTGGGGGDRGGISSLVDYASYGGGGGRGDEEDRNGAPSTPSGSRPYIYYEWDLGLNIPSPSDPKYTDYQKYLSERAAAQSSFGMV
jgi:LysM repeat protein